METTDRILVTMLILSIICGVFVLESQLLKMHYDHISIYNSIERRPNRQDRDVPSLRRIERAVSFILSEKYHSSSLDFTNITDDIISRLSRIIKENSSDRNSCYVPSFVINTTEEDFADSGNHDPERADAQEGWNVIPWISWIFIWIYRVLLILLIFIFVFDILPTEFRNHNGETFIRCILFIFASCVGYFPHVLMDVCGSHCTAWYFYLCKSVFLLLWVSLVCFVNNRFARENDIGTYVFLTCLKAIIMYIGFYPERIFT